MTNENFVTKHFSSTTFPGDEIHEDTFIEFTKATKMTNVNLAFLNHNSKRHEGYKCDSCGKFFPQTHKLKTHIHTIL